MSLYGNEQHALPKLTLAPTPKLSVGDRVRITKKRTFLKRGTHPGGLRKCLRFQVFNIPMCAVYRPSSRGVEPALLLLQAGVASKLERP